MSVRRFQKMARAAVLICVAGGLAACGGSEEKPSEAVACTPAPVPERMTLDIALEPGTRIPFTYEIEREDSGGEDESFSASTEGEVRIGSRSGDVYGIEWRLPERGLAFALAGPSSPDRIESELGATGGGLVVPLNIREDGRPSREIDREGLNSLIRESLVPVIKQLREEAPAEVSAEQAEFIGQALGVKLIEKPGLMFYPYGYELDPDEVISRSKTSYAAGGSFEFVEEIEVIDEESENGCVVVEIRDVPDSETLAARANEIGEVLGTFEASDLESIDAAFTNRVHYDAGAGLIRMIEYERRVEEPGRTIRIVDRLRASDPVGP